jgi:hypothetical protein
MTKDKKLYICEKRIKTKVSSIKTKDLFRFPQFFISNYCYTKHGHKLRFINCLTI